MRNNLLKEETKINICSQNQTTNIFDNRSEIKSGNKIYIVQRHFSGNRDFKEAIYSVVKNETEQKI